MKLRVFTIAVALGVVFVCARASAGEIQWGDNLERARTMAARSGKLLVIDFTATWCGPCREMERTTFQDADVVAKLSTMVCVRIDIDEQKKIAKAFGVNSIPRVIVIGRQNRTLVDALGYRDPDEFRDLLASALSGKPVAGSGLQAPTAPTDIDTLSSHVKAQDYAVWRRKEPAAAARALRSLLDRLGSFEPAERDEATALLASTGADGIATLLQGLGDSRLAVRVAAHTNLQRVLLDQHGIAAAAIPAYDPWASTPQRSQRAAALRAWWLDRQRQTLKQNGIG